VQTKNVNSNAIDDMIAVITTMQQFMIGLLGAVTEEQVAIKIKVVFSLLLGNGNNSHRPLTIVAFNANSTGGRPTWSEKSH
jgi:hypothetical protein